jgi:putative hydroxymethylpyrimidine transport system ATP-binding protein
MTANSTVEPAPPPPVGLRLRGAHLRFGDQTIFEDLAFDLPAGQTTCLLGPSGVGKSSLLRLFAGLSPETAATELSADDGAPLGQRIAFMDQRDLLLPWLDVLANVTLGARLRGETTDTAKAHRLLEKVGLGNDGAKKPAALSGGMRQRAALVRTLMEERPIALLDEPFSAVDVITRSKLQDLAAELLADKTVLLVTHDPMEALRLGHRVLVLSGSPARLGAPMIPAGDPPRDPRNAELQKMVGELLHQLAAAAA